MRRVRSFLAILAVFAGLLVATLWQFGPTGPIRPGASDTVVNPTIARGDNGLVPSVGSSTAPQVVTATEVVVDGTTAAAAQKTATPGTVGEVSSMTTPFPTASNSLEDTPEPPVVWLSREELAALVPSPEAIIEWADRDERVELGDQENQADAVAVAAAYVCANTGEQRYCERAQALIEDAMGTDAAGMKTLALNRNLAGYVVAASILAYDDPAFSTWLREVIHAQTWHAWTDDWSVYRSAMQEPNNWEIGRAHV